MTRVSFQAPTVTFDNSVGGAPITVDILDPANAIVTRASYGPGSMLTMLISNELGSADAYIGTAADIAAEPSPGDIMTNVVFVAGTVGASSPDYDIGRGRDLKFRLQDGAVITITPLISVR